MDPGLFLWDALLHVSDKRRALRGLALLDELRIVLAQSAPEECCVACMAARAVDGRVRCKVCGREQ
jgi:hypothetical protein